jgi:hypothetical protein
MMKKKFNLLVIFLLVLCASATKAQTVTARTNEFEVDFSGPKAIDN